MSVRRWLKYLLLLTVSLVGIVSAAYVYLFHLGGVESIISSKITSLTDQKYRLDVRVGKVSGSFLSDIIVEDIIVHYDDSVHRYRLLDIPRLTTAYSFSNLWDKRFIFDYLTIDSAEIVLLQDSSGAWVIPDFRSQKSADDTTRTLLPEFSVGELNLNGLSVSLVKPADTVVFDNIFLSLALRGEQATYSVDLEQFEFTSNRKKLALDAAGGKMTYSDNRLLFQDLFLVSGNSRVKVSGNVDLSRTPAGFVSFAADNLDLADITSYIGPHLTGVVDLNGTVNFVGSNLMGTADIGGGFLLARFENLFVDFSYEDKYLNVDTLYGTILGNCGIDGSGFIDFSGPKETYELRAAIKGFSLDSLISNSFASDLNGNIVLAGESFRNADLVLDLRADLYESSFDEYPIQRGSGDMVITTDSLVFPDSFRVDWFENTFYATGVIEYSGDMNLRVEIDARNLDRYRQKLFIDQPGGRGQASATLTGATSDPDLRGIFHSDSVWIYKLFSDSLFARVDIERFLSRKLGFVEVDFFRGTAWDAPYDTGFAYLRVDSNLVFFDTAYISNPYTQVAAAGNYDYEAIPGILGVDTLVLNLFGQTFYNRDKIAVDVDSMGFNFLQAAIGSNGARLSVNGRADYDETMDLLVSVENLPIEPWKNLFAESLLVSGCLSSEASLTGSFMEPQFVLSAQLDSLAYQDLLLGNVKASVIYGQKLLTIESFQLLSDYGDYHADGSFYVDLAFTADSVERFPNLPMEIYIAAVDSRFDLVSLLQPSVEELKGDFFADFILSGTPHEPHLEGEAFMIKPELKYFDLEHRLYGDSISVTMENNRIIIDTLEAHVLKDPKDPGEGKWSVFVNGTVTVMSLDRFFYDLGVFVEEKFPFEYELDDISGEVGGRLRVEGDTPPKVTGNMTLSSMRYFVNFAEPNELSPIIRTFFGSSVWDLEINFDIKSNYWIKNEDIDAEFAGEITMLRESGEYSFIGEMEVLRGRGFLFDKIFQLEPGGRVVFEGGETFNPSLDIAAYTYIAGSRGTDEESGDAERLRLGMRITGTLDEPEINVAEDSDIGSREDILPLIVANQYTGQGGVTATTSFESRVANLVSAQLSQIGSRQLGRLGVETFEIDPGYTGQFDPLSTRITVGWQDFIDIPNLYVYGRSALSAQSRQEVGFEYRFSKEFLLEGLRDEEELHHINLKLHWEF